MPSWNRPFTRAAIRAVVTPTVLALVVGLCAVTKAQQANLLNTGAVGGVLIDPSGMVSNAVLGDLGKLRQMRREIMGDVPEGLARATETRKVSLRRLDETIRQCRETGKPLPAEILCLYGLQRVHHVLLYPEQHDIVLVGPAEGWKIDDHGALVGATTGRPLLLLDDLRVALRAAGGPVRSVISCSIDPTQEGLQRLTAHTKKLRTIGNPEATALGIEQQLGPQAVSVAGVPDTSHFARVMVAADYRMKRVSMGHEPAPINGLTSFLGMMRATGRGMQNMLPRWWLAPDYQPPLRDADGLAWELRGTSVKAMAENDFLDAAGVRHQTGRADPVSQKWAEMMTDRYDELALADPVFGQLQNCMDLALVAALIVKEDLTAKAEVGLPMLIESDGLETADLAAPKQVESKAVLAKKGRNWLIACGGVEINPWAVVEKSERSDALAEVRSQAAAQSGVERWWD